MNFSLVVDCPGGYEMATSSSMSESLVQTSEGSANPWMRCVSICSRSKMDYDDYGCVVVLVVLVLLVLIASYEKVHYHDHISAYQHRR